MKGSIASRDEVHNEFMTRKKLVDEEAHNERDEKRKRRAERDENVNADRQVMRGDPAAE